MKLIRNIIIAVCILCLSTVHVCAYQTDDDGCLDFTDSIELSDISYKAYEDYENGNLNAVYYPRDDRAARVVSYVLFKPDVDLDAITEQQYLDHVVLVGYADIGDDGSYSIPVRIKGKSGTYKLVVKNRYVEKQFDIVHVYQVYIEFNDLLLNGDYNSMKAFVEENAEALKLDTAAYRLLSDADRQAVIYSLMGSESVASNDELFEVIDALELMRMLFVNAATPEPLLAYIEENLETEGSVFHAGIYRVFSEQIADEEKKNILESFMGSPFDADAALRFKLSTFKNLTSKLDYIREWENYVLDADGIWGFAEDDIKKYQESDKTQVLKYVKEATAGAEAMHDITDAFADAVEKFPSNSNNTGGGSFGSNAPGISGSGSPTETFIGSLEEEPDNPQANQGNAVHDSFDDIEDVQWAAEAINALKKEGIVNGVSENTFAPGNPVKREEFVKMLTAGLRLTGVGADVSMNDVSENDWFYSAVAAAVRAGIVKGNNSGGFGTGENITREDMAVMLHRALAAKGMTVEKIRAVKFADADEIADYAQEAVEVMAEAGVLSGMGGNYFAPKNPLTRAEAAVALYNFFVKIHVI